MSSPSVHFTMVADCSILKLLLTNISSSFAFGIFSEFHIQLCRVVYIGAHSFVDFHLIVTLLSHLVEWYASCFNYGGLCLTDMTNLVIPKF